MEIELVIKQLKFSTVGQLTHPEATVLALPKDRSDLSSGFVEIRFSLTNYPAAASGSPELVHAAALAAAQRFLNAEAVQAHLQAAAQADAALQQQHDAELRARIDSQFGPASAA